MTTFRTVEVNGERFVRADDVVEFLEDGGTNPDDFRDYLDDAGATLYLGRAVLEPDA